MKRLDEVPAITWRLKPKQIEAQQSPQHFGTPRKRLECIGRRKRDVMKVGKLLPDSAKAQVLSQHHQVVIMHPYEIAVPCYTFYAIRKFSIDRAIAGPICRVELTARRQAVKQRPDDFVREAAVVSGVLGGCQKHGLEVVIPLRRPLL